MRREEKTILLYAMWTDNQIFSKQMNPSSLRLFKFTAFTQPALKKHTKIVDE